ncbi:MAG: glycosyltransferase family 2 protein [Nitrospirales bacterium]|nr:glycosyltransferase family 2 protein [Nitrospirales bacterium]
MKPVSEPCATKSSQPQPRPAPSLVSFVFPVYNEIETLPYLRRELEAWLKDIPHAAEIILVDDGSRDGSFAFIRDWACSDQRVRGLSFSRNFGHQIAVSAGLAVAQGDAVVIMDADLQDPLDVVPEMLARYCEGYDVVYGQRAERKGETLFKRFTAWLFYRLMQRFVHPDLPEDTGDFRLVSRRCLDVILRMNEQHRFLRGLFAWIGFHQVAVRYNRDSRKYGQTKYPLLKMLKLAWNAILSFSTLPIKLITAGGFVTAAIAFAYGLYAIMQKYLFHNTVPGWTGLVVILGLIGGMILISLGVIGEYVGRIYEQVRHRPRFLVQAVLEREDIPKSTTRAAQFATQKS